MHASTLESIRHAAVRLGSGARDYDALVEAVGGRSFVLLGEASHGTREFYAMRADITRRLVVELGFDAVAVEADWPPAYRLDRFVRGVGRDREPEHAFGDFVRFPRWMWCNTEVLAFIAWLRAYNAGAAAAVGFHGLDLYSLYASADAVVAYLESVDHEQARIARAEYAALDHVRDPQRYGYEAAAGLRPDCSRAARERLLSLVRDAPRYVVREDAGQPADEQFHAERNAHVVLNAEAYYREMFAGRAASWNRRDAHMTETLFALRRHLRERGRHGRIVVWAHNSHLGDARATEMSGAGEWNVGQLVREQAGAGDALLVGFTTCTGTVTAAHDWDGEPERMRVRPARADSWEGLFRQTRLDRFYLPLGGAAGRSLRDSRLERAIGVIYRPDTERQSHYFDAVLPDQFDAVFHLDETEAIEPLVARSEPVEAAEA